MNEQLTYSPWIPRTGMRGFYRECVAVWGDPNIHDARWPPATLHACCQRSEPRPPVFDEHGASSRVYFLRK